MALWIALPALAYLFYELWGHWLVQRMYEQSLPLSFLNQVINRQGLHPLEYYTHKADAAVQGLLLLVIGSGILVWGYARSRRRWPASQFSQPLWGTLFLATACFWLLYLFQIPLFQALPHWFWSLHLTPLPWGWLSAPLAALSLMVVRAVLNQPEREGRNLFLLVLLGLALQHGFAWMEGRGLEGLAGRLQESGGHGRLAQEAMAQQSLWRVLTRYEQLLESGELSPFPHATRPPGQLLFLMLAGRLAQWGSQEPVQRLAFFAAWIFPLLSCLVVIPLFYLCRLLAPGPAAWVPALLYLFIPSTVLVTLHLDQCLYPPMAWSCACLYAYALWREWPAAATGVGVLFYLALFLSFSLAAMGVVLAALHAQAGLQQRRSGWKTAALAGAGFAGAALVFYLLFDYDLLLRYERAMAAHEYFKVVRWDAGRVLYCALLNTLEFAVWCGPAVGVLVVSELRKGGWRAWQGTGTEVLALALVGVLAGLALFGRTAGETARLWIFLVPLVVGTAAGPLGRLEEGLRVKAVGLVVVLQLVTILVLKRFQDFF